MATCITNDITLRCRLMGTRMEASWRSSQQPALRQSWTRSMMPYATGELTCKRLFYSESAAYVCSTLLMGCQLFPTLHLSNAQRLPSAKIHAL